MSQDNQNHRMCTYFYSTSTANIKYHANPILVLDVDRLYTTLRNVWVRNDLLDESPSITNEQSPLMRLTMEVHNNFTYVVVSKETVPSFLFLGNKV